MTTKVVKMPAPAFYHVRLSLHLLHLMHIIAIYIQLCTPFHVVFLARRIYSMIGKVRRRRVKTRPGCSAFRECSGDETNNYRPTSG